MYSRLSQSSDAQGLSVDRSMHRWSDGDLQMMALWGNARANAYIHCKVVMLMVDTGEPIFIGKQDQICHKENVKD